MFIAMNRFKVKLGEEKYFEDIWKNRDTHLNKVPGFKKFNLIKSESNDEYTPVSYTHLTLPTTHDV